LGETMQEAKENRGKPGEAWQTWVVVFLGLGHSSKPRRRSWKLLIMGWPHVFLWYLGFKQLASLSRTLTLFRHLVVSIPVHCNKPQRLETEWKALYYPERKKKKKKNRR
jgi:hypothetical protein